MPVSLKYLVNTVTGSVTTLNGCAEDSEAGGSGEVYAPTRFKEEDLPAMVDMREFMTEVENQAGAGSCTANAVVGAFEYIMARSGEKVDFSRLFVYYNARDVENRIVAQRAAEEAKETGEYFDPDDESWYEITDSGSSIYYALCALQVRGICKEETWDYEVRCCEVLACAVPPPTSRRAASHALPHYDYDDWSTGQNRCQSPQGQHPSVR
jgi:hypothetical protein